MSSGRVGYDGLPPLGRRPSGPVASFTARATPANLPMCLADSAVPRIGPASLRGAQLATGIHFFLSSLPPLTNAVGPFGREGF